MRARKKSRNRGTAVGTVPPPIVEKRQQTEQPQADGDSHVIVVIDDDWLAKLDLPPD